MGAKTAAPQLSSKPAALSSARTTSQPTRSPLAAQGLQQSIGNAASTRLLRSTLIQPKLNVSQPEDESEREADRVADQVMRMPESSSRQEPADTRAPIQCESCEEPDSKKELQRKAVGAASSSVVPVSVEQTLNSGGLPLDPITRSFMEGRFGHDFSRVRVHSDAAAGQSARAVNASAYTVGNNIVFDAGRFSPTTHDGRKLLAHELSHVVQQSSGNVFLGRQKAKDDKDKKVSKRIKIPPGTTSVREFRLYAETKIFGRVLNLKWEAESPLAGVYQNISKHIGQEVEFIFSASFLETHSGGSEADQAGERKTAAQDYAALTDNERAQINEEVDKRYYETGAGESKTKIKRGEAGKAAIWNALKQQLLADKRRIESLPQDIKDVIFAGGPDAPVLTPDNYDDVLRIADKLSKISPEDRQDYLARVNASATSLAELESSVDAYLEFREQRKKEADEIDDAAAPLLGAENLYAKVKAFKKYKQNAEGALEAAKSGRHQAAEHVDEIKKGLRDAETRILAELSDQGFDSIESFDTAINTYRVSFRTQAVNLAMDLLARYDHMLFEERKHLQKPGVAAAIAQGIAKSNAAKFYEEASEQSSAAESLRSFHEPKERWWIEPARKAEAAAAKAYAEAEAAVISGSGNDPIVAERGTDREKLAGLDPEEVPAFLFETIDDRADDVRETREEFRDDPDRVFKLPELIAATKHLQGVEGTVYETIINDYIEAESLKHLLSEIALAICATILAFVPVAGWVGVAALVAGAGISTYQGITAYHEYKQQQREYNLHFLSEEPSLFWVGVAIAGAALDLGVAASAILKESAVALKALEKPLVEFSKDGDLSKLVAKIEEAEHLDVKVKLALEREAAASLAAEKAMQPGGKLFGVGPGGAAIIATGQLFRVLFHQVRRGVRTISRLRADKKFLEAIGEITRITGAERKELEAAFEEVKQLVKTGEAKAMDDESLLGFVDRWAANRNTPGFKEKLFDEMKGWKPLNPKQKQALASVVKQKTVVASLYQEQAALRYELAGLRKKPPTELTAADQSRLLEINQRLAELDPTFGAATTRILVKERNEEGELVEKVVTVPAKHPPGEIKKAEGFLEQAEKHAAELQVTLYDRLRAAAPSEAAKQRALKGITTDQVGPLKIASGPLEVDHIVSVREIADMDGFADLLWIDQKAIVDMKENLIPMNKFANSSKGKRSWKSWDQASDYYQGTTIEAMIKREEEVRKAIKAEIAKRLPANRLKP